MVVTNRISGQRHIELSPGPHAERITLSPHLVGMRSHSSRMPNELAERKVHMCGRLRVPNQTETIDQMKKLTVAEQLLIRTFRRWVTGMRLNNEYLWNQAWTELSESFGEDCTKAILSGLQSVILGIGTYARKPMRLHPPCCSGVSEDEIAILAIIGACQRREHIRSRIVGEWIVSCEGLPSLLEGAARIAAALNQKNVQLPDRSRSNQAMTIGVDALETVSDLKMQIIRI